MSAYPREYVLYVCDAFPSKYIGKEKQFQRTSKNSTYVVYNFIYVKDFTTLIDLSGTSEVLILIQIALRKAHYVMWISDVPFSALSLTAPFNSTVFCRAVTLFDSESPWLQYASHSLNNINLN